MKNVRAYLDSIRSTTEYPVYRGVIGTIATVLKVLGVLQGLGGVIGGFILMKESAFIGLALMTVAGVCALLFYFLAQCWYEGGMMIADLTDGVLSSNSRS